MSRHFDFAPENEIVDQTEPLSPGSRLGWWGGYGILVLMAFCFGVWTGNQRQKPVEAVAAPAAPHSDKAQEPAPEPGSKKDLVPEPKKGAEPKKGPEVVVPEPKKAPEVVPPEPKKMPEVVKTPEPKTTPAPNTPAVKEVLFAKDVLPIFKSKCNLCHGDTKGPKGDLDLRTLASIAKGGDSGAAVKGGDLKTGSIWTAVEDGSMPPAGKEQLTDAEKLVIRNWILSGAK